MLDRPDSSIWNFFLRPAVQKALSAGLLLTTLMLGARVESCGSTEPTGSAPVWTSIPTVNLVAGNTTTLDLDDYVSDADTADSSLLMSIYGASSSSVSATVDASSHVVTLKAASTYAGTTNLEAFAEDPEGNGEGQVFSVVVTAGSTPTPSTIAFTSVQNGGTYTNPVTFKVNASSDINLVKYSALSNGTAVSIGESSDRASGFAITYTFSTTGSRTITTDGYANGTKVASATITLTVNSTTSSSSLSFTSPTDGSSVSGAVWFKSKGSSDITKVIYTAPYNGQSFELGQSTDVSNGFPVSYTFSNPGSRQVDAAGYNSAGSKVATASLTITVTSTSTSTSSGEGGLGSWLYYIEGTGYTHAQLADKLKGLGIQRIFVKVSDGTSIWPEATDTSIPDTYQARGIEAWAWSYNYPGNTTTQANALYTAAKTGYDGYILDLEIEFDGKSSELHSLLGAFRDARTKAQSEGKIPAGWPMYATTWGNPKDHNFRIDIVDQYVDAHMPQTYLEVWGASYMADPSYWVNYGTQEYRSLGATKPIHHVISSEYDEITAAQINEAFETSGCESSLWRIPGGGTPTSIWTDWASVNWSMCAAPDAANLSFVSPLNGGSYQNGIWFKVTGSSSVKKVAYYADGFKLGESTDASQNYAVKYTFSQTGQRTVIAYGYDSSGAQLGQVSVTFTVVGSTTTTGCIAVPYYYQYNNAYNPGGSCQNTSVAMLLTHYGCKTTPDTISAAWGTSYAQTPAGLAEVFNSYASKCGIKQRLKAHTDGDTADVNALLAAGKPVIVHGYFTSYGHVLVLTGYDGSQYCANDPAGIWKETFKGGYYSSDSDDGKGIKYDKSPTVQAIATLDGYSYYPIWYHEVLN